MTIGERFSFSSLISLKTLISGIVAVLAFAIAVIIAAFALMWIKNGFRLTLAAQQDVLITRAANAIDRQIAIRREMLRAVSADIPKDESRKIIQDFLLQQVSAKRHFDNFYIFNAQSELIANFNQPIKAPARTFSNLKFINDTLSSGKEILTVSSLEESGKAPGIVLTVPVKNLSGQIALVLAASIDIADINLPAQLSELKSGYAGYAYISMEDGTILAHSDPERALKTVSYHQGKHSTLPVVSYQAGPRQALGAFGGHYVVTTKKLQSCNWMLTAVLPEAELLMPVRQVEAILPAAAALLAGLCGLLVWWVVHIRMLPLQDASRRLQARRFSKEAAADSPTASSDEINGLVQAVDAFLQDLPGQPGQDLEFSNQERVLQSLIDYLPVLAFVISLRPDNYGQIIAWNRKAESITGYSAGQAVGKEVQDIFPLQLGTILGALDLTMLNQPNVTALPEFTYHRPDGDKRILRMQVVPLARHEKCPDYVLGIMEDVSASYKQHADLLQKQAELEAVSCAASLGLVYCGPDGKCNQINHVLEQMFDMPLPQLYAKGWQRCIHIEDRFRMMVELSAWQENDAHPYAGICRLRYCKGNPVWVTLKVVAVRMDGKVSGYIGSVEDITARRAGELALMKSEHRLRLITDNIPALVAYVTPDKKIGFANRRYEDAYGVLHEELFGMHVSQVLGPEVYRQSRPYIEEALAGNTVHFEREARSEHGVRYERVSYIPDVGMAGEIVGYYGLVEDITSHKAIEAQLRKLVRVDALTGIANRMQFEEKLDSAIRYSRRYCSLMAVMFLDIDHFKSINDTYGHQGGDEVLCEFAQRLLCCVRNTDTVARLAGDEFVIILEGLSMPEEGAAVARKIILAMEQAFHVLGTQCRITTSIGVAVRREGEEDAAALLRRADEALYRAKAAGRNTFENVI